jgi:hypothetical protein
MIRGQGLDNRNIQEAYDSIEEGLINLPAHITFDIDSMEEIIAECLMFATNNGQSYFTYGKEISPDTYELAVIPSDSEENDEDYLEYGTIRILFSDRSCYVSIYDLDNHRIGKEIYINNKGVYADNQIIKYWN